MSDKVRREEEHAARDADLSKRRREAREWSGREGRSGRDETAARLLDEREAAQEHAKDERRSNERAGENSDKGRQEVGKEMTAAHYTYEAMWSEEERAFIARVAEFPSLEARGDSRGSSLRALKGVVDAVVKDLAESGEEIPNAAQSGKEER